MKRKLYYIDGNEVVEHPYTKERAESVCPIWYETRAEALKQLRWLLQVRLVSLQGMIAEIDAELAK